jgi:3-oxoacyl-[acyl-carrier protein] reductase
MDRPVALVTGASRGIGRAVALQLARDGFAVALNFRADREGAEKTRSEIEATGGRATLVPFDVTQREDVRRAVLDLVREWDRIRVLVNNAGTVRDHPLMRMPDDDWHHVIDVNLHGAFYCTKAVLRSMAGKRVPGRRIINMASAAGEVGNAGQTNYAASKAGLIGFTRALALELAPTGITVNAVSPGPIETEGLRSLPTEQQPDLIPMGRLGRPEEVAHAVSNLAAERSEYITGQVIRVNGGLVM